MKVSQVIGLVVLAGVAYVVFRFVTGASVSAGLSGVGADVGQGFGDFAGGMLAGGVKTFSTFFPNVTNDPGLTSNEPDVFVLPDGSVTLDRSLAARAGQ